MLKPSLLILLLTANCFGQDLIPSPQGFTPSKSAESQALLTTGTTIAYNDAESQKVAELLAEDLKRIFQLEFSVAQSEIAREGFINVFLTPTEEKEKDSAYRLEVSQAATLTASTRDGLLAGSASILQLAEKAAKGISLPFMDISDGADRDFRSVMIDVKNHWHPVSELKKIIDLARFYKVNYLSLHTGEGQWIGALTEQMEDVSEEERRKHKFYTKAEMEEVIAYGGERGVYLLPHNESTPHFGHMVNAMKKDYAPDDSFAGFADELDGKGAYDFSGQADQRWYEVMEIATSKAIDQFAAGHSDGVLPYYHIGPVLGEGGMSPDIAAKVIEMVIKKSPKTKVVFWNGPSAQDKALEPYKANIVVAYYDDEFGQSDINAYLKEGWEVINAAWSPLYIVGTGIARPVEKVFSDWNMLRQGSDGIPGGYGAITWEKVNPEYADKVIGGMLATWEVPTKSHFTSLQRRVPAYVENAWKITEWPYSESAYPEFEKRFSSIAKKFASYTSQLDEAPKAPISLKATNGSAKDRVLLKWRSSGFDEGFHILRSTENDGSKATKIASLPQLAQDYSDTDVETETEYFYWVKSFNSKGESPLSESASGKPGTGIAGIQAYEPYDYIAKEEVAGADGGEGWKGNWEVQTKGNAYIKFDKEGLSYGELPASGGSFRFKSVDDGESVQVKRSMQGTLGMDETTVWTSCLFRANKVGDGDVFLAPNGNTAASIGKNWGNRFAVYITPTATQISPGETYFLVAKYDFEASGDKVTLWINPPLDQTPDPATASGTGVVDAQMGNLISYNLQGHGKGDYNLDELRMGEKWTDVGGQLNKDDKNAPEPDVMTWINPPSLTEDGSVYMQAAEASDQSGIEYRFACSDTKFSSSWQTSPSYQVKLGSGTHKFRVKARDKSTNRNENEWSFVGEVTVP